MVNGRRDNPMLYLHCESLLLHKTIIVVSLGQSSGMVHHDAVQQATSVCHTALFSRIILQVLRVSVEDQFFRYIISFSMT